MNIFKKWVGKKRNTKVILIHGFSTQTSSEMNYLRDFLMEEGFDVVVPALFNPNDEEDIDWLKWVSKARVEFEKAKESGKELFVVGYSMGGVVATYLSTIFSVKKLVLLAPAFEYRTLTTVKRTVTGLMNNEKKAPGMSLAFHLPFMNLVDELKNSVEVLKYPVLMIQGSEDQTIPQTVAKKAYKKIPHGNKKLIIIEDGTHRLMDDLLTRDLVNCFVLNFYNSNI